MSETKKEQIKDMTLGLIECWYSFLWEVKLKMVDKEEEEGLEDVLGSELMGKVREKGVVVKEFVDQMKGTKGGERNGDCKENQRDDKQ